MATVYMGVLGPTEIPDNDPRIRAYDAVNVAIQRICRGAFKAASKGGKVRRFTPPEEATTLVALLPKILRGDVSPETAMATLHTHDILKARLADR